MLISQPPDSGYSSAAVIIWAALSLSSLQI
jgi:hypothetical protein